VGAIKQGKSISSREEEEKRSLGIKVQGGSRRSHTLKRRKKKKGREEESPSWYGTTSCHLKIVKNSGKRGGGKIKFSQFSELFSRKR